MGAAQRENDEGEEECREAFDLIDRPLCSLRLSSSSPSFLSSFVVRTYVCSTYVVRTRRQILNRRTYVSFAKKMFLLTSSWRFFLRGFQRTTVTTVLGTVALRVLKSQNTPLPLTRACTDFGKPTSRPVMCSVTIPL